MYSHDGDALLGTAGAIKKALPLLDENFFVMYGDSYLDCDYLTIQRAYEKENKLSLMTVFKNNNQIDKSNIEFKFKKILDYNKRSPKVTMQYIDYGVGLFNKRALDTIPPQTYFDLADLYKRILQKEQLAGFEVCQRFYEIGSLNGLNDLENYLISMERRYE
jgi:MurNAc alpha-1-phosphate uridylyltransferase